MLKLKLQYFGHLMQRTNSLEKTLMLIKIEGGRRRGQQWVRWLDGITDSMDMSLSSSRSWWWTGKPGVLQSMVSQRVGHNWMTELNWRIPLSTGLSLLGKISGVHKTGGRRPAKFLGELLLHVELLHDTAMKQPRRSSLLRRISMWLLPSGVPWDIPAHNSSQYHQHPALTSQHLSSPLPLRPTSFRSSAHWFSQGLIPLNLGHSPKLTHYPGEVSLSCQDQESW